MEPRVCSWGHAGRGAWEDVRAVWHPAGRSTSLCEGLHAKPLTPGVGPGHLHASSFPGDSGAQSGLASKASFQSSCSLVHFSASSWSQPLPVPATKGAEGRDRRRRQARGAAGYRPLATSRRAGRRPAGYITGPRRALARFPPPPPRSTSEGTGRSGQHGGTQATQEADSGSKAESWGRGPQSARKWKKQGKPPGGASDTGSEVGRGSAAWPPGAVW